MNKKEVMSYHSHAMQRNNTENLKQLLPEKELRCHSHTQFPLSCVLRDLYISTNDLPILLQENMWTDPRII
jgi:hypothetical protein